MDRLKEDLYRIRDEAKKSLAQCKSTKDVLSIKSEFLGRKGKISSILKAIPKLPKEEIPILGKLANEIKVEIEREIESAIGRIEDDEIKKEIEKESYDLTLPGKRIPVGKPHPITMVTEEILNIFKSMGFEVVKGPEVEYDYYNFEALNIPPEHPARDMHDTFYINDRVLLRPHTSPVQIRIMEKKSPPIQIVAPGKVYRHDSDISHTPMFHQVEGLLVDEDVTFSDLKGVLTLFLEEIFGKDTKVRFRPSYFPFTEPSAEVDIGCFACGGDGCRLCGGTGWIEILGCGMVNPAVFLNVGYDPEKYLGFAFGLGVERIAMLKYGIKDIRLFFENDLRFLEQF